MGGFSIDVRAIKARCDAATPGPWGTYRSMNGWHYTKPDCPRGVLTVDDQSRADVEFIAAARQDIPALLFALERLRSAAKLALAAPRLTDALAERLRKAIAESEPTSAPSTEEKTS